MDGLPFPTWNFPDHLLRCNFYPINRARRPSDPIRATWNTGIALNGRRSGQLWGGADTTPVRYERHPPFSKEDRTLSLPTVDQERWTSRPSRLQFSSQLFVERHRQERAHPQVDEGTGKTTTPPTPYNSTRSSIIQGVCYSKKCDEGNSGWST